MLIIKVYITHFLSLNCVLGKTSVIKRNAITSISRKVIAAHKITQLHDVEGSEIHGGYYARSSMYSWFVQSRESLRHIAQLTCLRVSAIDSRDPAYQLLVDAIVHLDLYIVDITDQKSRSK